MQVKGSVFRIKIANDDPPIGKHRLIKLHKTIFLGGLGTGVGGHRFAALYIKFCFAPQTWVTWVNLSIHGWNG